MNKEQSLALYEKGVDAWNSWANEMLAKKAELEKNGQWQIDESGQALNQVTKDWIKNSTIDFDRHNFNNKFVIFTSFIFPYSVNFENAGFGGDARFNKATFNGDAEFNKATFSGNANFNSATFSGDAIFQNTTFSGDTRFIQASFKTYADFYKTNFESNSSFIAIKGESYFSFMDAKFHIVPDFDQAHFDEAPQFDKADFSKALQSEGNFSSNWRSLKRLAIQGHDHERELMFFAEEIKSQRGTKDKAFPNPVNYFNNEPVWPGGARYWFGYLYQYSSDFGRSVMRPLLWLLFFGFLFQVLYLNYPIDSEPQETISCNQSEAATYLSVRSALPFLPSAIYPENLSRNYECLYGKDNAPSVIVFITIFQAILLTILIFLLLLALRNHFRIK